MPDESAGSRSSRFDYAHVRDSRDLFFIMGPCVIESEQMAMDVADELAGIKRKLGITIFFKSSFDKANRTSVDSFRGPGLVKGLEILGTIGEKTGLPVVSDIHTPDQADFAAQVLDVIQIPAFLSRQTDMLLAAGKTGRAVNVKKGQFQSPEDMKHALKKVVGTGNSRIFLTERGTCFGYGDLVVDMRSIVRMGRFGYPVIFDATHSAQFPGRGEGCSGGDRSLAPPLARAAVAAGADGIFMEVHPDPDHALCDGPNSLALKQVESVLLDLIRLKSALSDNDTINEHLCEKKIHESMPAKLYDDRLKKIRLIIFDVDGILTDGSIIFAGNDLEIKSFNVRDGHGIKIAKRCGLEVALVTGRTSDVVARRAHDLGLSLIYQGIWDKKPVLADLLEKLQLNSEEVAVMGDDVVDIPLMRRVGVSFTVPEAPEEVLKASDHVTSHSGGHGAAREVVELVLKAQGKWEGALARYFE